MANDKNKDSVIKPDFSVKKFILASLKSWKTYAVCMGALAFLSLAYIYVRKPVYEVDAQLMLPQDTGSGGILALSDMASNFSFGDIFGASSSENEIALMKSYTVMLNTAKQLGLNVEMYERTRPLKWMPTFDDSQLSISTLPSIPDTLGVTLKFDISINDNGTINTVVKRKRNTLCDVRNASLPAAIETPFGTFTIDKTKAFGVSKSRKVRIIYRSYSAAAQSYAATINAFIPNKKADIIGLAYTTTNPEFGQLLLNTVINNYNALCNEQKNDKSSNTLNFVDSRLSSLELQLAQTESDMEAFKKNNRIVEPEYDAAALIKKSDEIEAQLLIAQTQNEIIGLTRDFIANPANKYSLIPSIGQSSSVSGTESAYSEINTYNQLILERMKLESSAKQNNAALLMLNSQIDAMRENVITSVERAYQNSTVALNKLIKESQATTSRMGEIPSLEREYITLERNFRIQQQLYLFLLKQKEEASMTINKVQPSLITVDPPYTLSKTPGLSNMMVLLIALFFGAVIAALIVFSKKMNLIACDSPKEVDKLSTAPVLGFLPYTESELPVAQRDGGEAIRMVRANIEDILNIGHLMSSTELIIVTSYQEDEGKSYAAANLAASYALMGLDTLLIGADFNDTVVNDIIGSKGTASLADVVASGVELDDIANVAVGNASLKFLPAGNSGNSNPSDILFSPAMTKFVENLNGKVDRIIIDCPNLEGNSGAYAFSNADISLVVAQLGVATPKEIFAINDLREDGKLRNIAIVVNDKKK